MENNFKPTYLYVKTHNITGLKYFGKTIKDPLRYKGSGKYWTNHIHKHGYNVSTEIIGFYITEEDCINAALKFSQQYNIVESTEWANLIPENGKTGGLQHNSGQNFKLINLRPRTKEHKENISKALAGTIPSLESNRKKSINVNNRHPGEAKPITICRISDHKEMSSVSFAQYIRWNKTI